MLHLTSHCNGGDCFSWSYDASGNRLSEVSGAGSVAYQLEAGSDRLLYTAGPDAVQLDWDAAGAARQIGDVQISRDAAGRFVSASELGQEHVHFAGAFEGLAVQIAARRAPATQCLKALSRPNGCGGGI